MLGRHLSEVFGSDDPASWDVGELDIADEESVRERVTIERPELIINAAAYTDVDGAETNRAKAFAVNEAGVRNIAKVAKDIGVPIVHYSTDYVFAGDNKEGYAENDAPGPAINTYGESKLAGERALAEIAPEFYLLRTAWLYGKGGKNFVDTIMRIGREKDTISIVDDQHGSPTYAKDLALATREIVAGDYKPGIYHATNAGIVTWFGLAREIVRLADIDTKVEAITSADYPLPAMRPSYSVLRNNNGPELRKWQKALEEYINSLVSS